MYKSASVGGRGVSQAHLNVFYCMQECLRILHLITVSCSKLQNSSMKNEISVITYSPACRSEPRLSSVVYKGWYFVECPGPISFNERGDERCQISNRTN